MRRRKSIAMLFILSHLIVIILIVSAPNARSFNNGGFSGTTIDAYDIARLRRWLNDNEHYSTHDWIGEAVIDAILADAEARAKWINDDLIGFWTEQRIIIYLIGTEAPDTTASKLKLRLNDVEATGLGGGMHKITFNPEDSYPSDEKMKVDYDTNLKKLINEYTSKVEKYLSEGKCELAAFYMGIITHYISDMASFPHVLRSEEVDDSTQNFKNRHIGFESTIETQTNDHNNREKTEGFTYLKIGQGGWNQIARRKPWECALLLGFNTRWNFSIPNDDYGADSSDWTPGSHTATWLYKKYMRYSWWHITPGYKERVQENLDNAVKYCAEAINYIGGTDEFHTWSGECKECEKKALEQQTLDQWIYGSFLVVIIIYLGISSAILGPLGIALTATTAKSKALETAPLL